MWREDKERKERYLEERKEWRELCKVKEKEFKEWEEEQLRQIRNENDVWKFLNSARRRREKVENRILKEDWKKHFVTLLEGAENRKFGTGRQICEEQEEKHKEKNNSWRD